MQVLYLMKTFVVKTLHYCNLLCYVNCSTPLLPLQSNVKEGHDVGYVDDEGMTFNPDRLLSTAYVHTNYVGRPT